MRRMSKQCCPSSRPSMQNGQTRPLEKQRSFCARLHTQAPPILLVHESLLCLCHREMRASLGSHHANLFGRGDRKSKPVVVVFQPGAQIQIVAIHGRGSDPGHGDLCLMHSLHHRVFPVHTWSENRRWKTRPAFSQRGRSSRKSARKIEFAVEQRVAKAANVGEKDPAPSKFSTCFVLPQY
jgi:hypothetical protein